MLFRKAYRARHDDIYLLLIRIRNAWLVLSEKDEDSRKRCIDWFTSQKIVAHKRPFV